MDSENLSTLGREKRYFRKYMRESSKYGPIGASVLKSDGISEEKESKSKTDALHISYNRITAFIYTSKSM